MYGFEFSNLKSRHSFPAYDLDMAVPAESIEKLVPLVWQEHCVECGMPECYKTCVRYQKRSDGRCKLFKYGIERIKNSKAILGQNAIIEMREWAKLETFFFSKVMSYKTAKKVNSLYVAISKIAQCVKNGKVRRLCYYAKEYISRKISYTSKEQIELPEYLLVEIFNENTPYSLVLENNFDNQIVFRTTLQVNQGYNRFLIPTKNLRFEKGKMNNLCIYSNEERELVINLISLEMVDFKKEYRDTVIPKNQKKVKVVVWDLDNTIWDGILSEDGADGIKLKPEILDVIKSLDEKGIINSIASKNDIDKVTTALQKLGIQELFVAPMANWQPKSQSIKAISKNLDLALDTFVFVDDTPNELQEVLANCSDVRVCDVKKIKEYVEGKDFDVPVTEESRRRRQMYQELSKRNADALTYEDDIDEFLKDCKMVMHINNPDGKEIERCFELLQRTNQLNISAERLSREELDELVNSLDYECYRIKVDDKYGDYGLVGFAVFEIKDSQCVVLRHFVFSCRAARKKLEQAFFERMVEIYKEKCYSSLRLICKKTERNALMQSVLAECGLFRKENETPEGFELTVSFDVDFVPGNIVTVEMN